MKNLVYQLDRPGGVFTAVEEEIGEPGPGEIRLRTLRTGVCQSDVVIYRQGLSPHPLMAGRHPARGELPRRRGGHRCQQVRGR